MNFDPKRDDPLGTRRPDLVSTPSGVPLADQFLPGTDFVTSGYSVMRRHDTTFGGGNFDSDDLDEWLTMQCDWQVDAGIEPVEEDEVVRVRERASRAVQAVFAELGLPSVTDAEVEAATLCYDSDRMPDRDRAADVEAADAPLARSRASAGSSSRRCRTSSTRTTSREAFADETPIVVEGARRRRERTRPRSRETREGSPGIDYR